MARFQPVLVFALVLLPKVVVGLPTCCVNSTSGVAFENDCVCLVDNTPLPGQILTAGETRFYHWVLGMNNSELVSGSIRGNLTFEVSSRLNARMCTIPGTPKHKVLGTCHGGGTRIYFEVVDSACVSISIATSRGQMESKTSNK